jgi:hydroxypyruvate reductase
VARAHAEHALAHVAGGRAVALLSGGELTVRVRGTGRGGRNQEYALALALALDGAPGIAALAADTDGLDGTSEAAGAVIASDSLRRAARMGLDPARMLAENNADQFFARLGDLVRTGPTLTNVNDFRAILIDPARLP